MKRLLCVAALLALGTGCSPAKKSPSKPVRGAPDPAAFTVADRQVCVLAGSLFPEGYDGLQNWLVRYLVADVDGDGRPDRLEVVDPGTAHFYSTSLSFANGKQIWPDVPLGAIPDEEMPWAKSERLMPYAGQIYVLTYRGRAPVYLRMISRLRPDGTLLPRCRFTPETSVDWGVARDLSGNDKAARLCKAAREGRFETVREMRYARPRRNDGFVPGGWEEFTREIRLDFRNDGRPERLLRAESTSGAGAGCDHIEYRAAGAASEASRVLLEDLQRRDPVTAGTESWYRNCRDEDVRWLRYRGRTYLELKQSGAASPSDEEAELHFLATVENGRAHRVCEASYAHMPPIENARWNGRAWIEVKP